MEKGEKPVRKEVKMKKKGECENVGGEAISESSLLRKERGRRHGRWHTTGKLKKRRKRQEAYLCTRFELQILKRSPSGGGLRTFERRLTSPRFGVEKKSGYTRRPSPNSRARERRQGGKDTH